ncbi:MAG: hypothetical protein LBK61_06645 [Spirochaetaceae bacterium]|nr:hypothetical protein [Spirochaetaceae bacterium]
MLPNNYYHLGAFPAAPETGLCGAPLFAPAPASPWLNPSNPLRGSTPTGGENPSGFHPSVKPTPILAGESAAGRQNTAMRRLCFPCGRAMPPHGGILPAVTMPDRGGRGIRDE